MRSSRREQPTTPPNGTAKPLPRSTKPSFSQRKAAESSTSASAPSPPPAFLLPTQTTTAQPASDLTVKKRQQEQPQPLVEGDKNLRDIDRPPPGDRTTNSTRKVKSIPELSKQRSAYFQDAFSMRDETGEQIQNRVRAEAVVVMEIVTNVIVSIPHA